MPLTASESPILAPSPSSRRPSREPKPDHAMDPLLSIEGSALHPHSSANNSSYAEDSFERSMTPHSSFETIDVASLVASSSPRLEQHAGVLQKALDLVCQHPDVLTMVTHLSMHGRLQSLLMNEISWLQYRAAAAAAPSSAPPPSFAEITSRLLFDLVRGYLVSDALDEIADATSAGDLTREQYNQRVRSTLQMVRRELLRLIPEICEQDQTQNWVTTAQASWTHPYTLPSGFDSKALGQWTDQLCGEDCARLCSEKSQPQPCSSMLNPSDDSFRSIAFAEQPLQDVPMSPSSRRTPRRRVGD